MIATEKMKETLDSNTARIAKLEILMQQHLKACEEQQVNMRQVLEVLENVRASMKVANLLRTIFLWLSGIAVAGIALYRSIKGLK